MPTDTARVIETLRRSPGLSDDELARQASVDPGDLRQICRYLEILGRLTREQGPDGFVINTLIDI
jgi:DNA-binding MarR family transcriptional regulator